MNIILDFLPFALFFIMLGVGMSVSIKNIIDVFKDLKVLCIGLFLQMLILPTIGFLFAIVAPVDIIFKLGIILIASVPSAVTSNYITKLVDGNIALSVSLTAITTFFSFTTIPFVLIFVAPILISEATVFQELNFVKISLFVLSMATLPVLIGIFIKTKFFIFVEKIKKFYSFFSLLLFFIIIFTAWFSEWNFILSLYKTIGLFVALLLILIFITAYTLTNLFNLSEVNKKTIIIESLIQNAAVAIVVGSVAFGNESGYLAVAALYALLQYKFLIFIWATNKLYKKFILS